MQNYVGIGPSSHSRIFRNSNFVKLKNTRDLSKWLGTSINPYDKNILSQI